MTIESTIQLPYYHVSKATFAGYIDSFVARFYKILPLKEEGEKSLPYYIESFQREMVGCAELFPEVAQDSIFITLLSVLEYLKNNDCDVAVVKQEVFRSIQLVKRMSNNYRRGCRRDE